jgi:hypothetical protein
MAYDAVSLGNQLPSDVAVPTAKTQKPACKRLWKWKYPAEFAILNQYVSRGENQYLLFFFFLFCAHYPSIYTLHTQIFRSEVSSELVPLAMAFFFGPPHPAPVK